MMFKKFVWLLAFVGFAGMFFTAGCNNKNSGSSSAGTPTEYVNPTSSCINSSGNYSCQPNYYSDNGWQVYPYDWQYQNGSFCGCGNGYRPVYNPGWGMGCSPYYSSSQWLDSSYSYFSFSWNNGWNPYGVGYASNTQVLNTQTFSYDGVVNYGNQTCFQNIAVACDTRLSGSCGGTGQCRPVNNGASALGLCVYQVGNYQPNNFPVVLPNLPTGPYSPWYR